MARATKNKQFGERLVNLIKSSPDADFGESYLLKTKIHASF